jgi:asparagine synthase (glutamine-hydrolysing)
MGIQFGKCNFDGKPVGPHDLDKVREMLAPYGPDGERCIRKGNVGILYRAFHTTKESRRETQPHVSRSGVVITWDGRLDNRERLIAKLAGQLPSDSSDSEIIAAAYERWGTGVIAELIGDWALSVWNPEDQSVILAKDFVGTRHLYYTVEKDQVTWCSILDPLVLFAGRPFKLEGEYVAGWLSFFPASHLTPYVGIVAVPPSSFVYLARGIQKVSKYWDFDPGRKVRYSSDAEYEEHFRYVFAESIRRRLRSDTCVLAQLSGGMDSSSIVCVADDIIGRGDAQVPGLETVSYYDQSEPNWDESPYFTEVERKRGREGHHIAVRGDERLNFNLPKDRFPMSPNSPFGNPDREFNEHIVSRGYRVVLCGIGGDEVTGGVPTPTPELSDLLATGQLKVLARQLLSWAIFLKKPWFFLLSDAMKVFLPREFLKPQRYQQPASWLRPEFVRTNREALGGYDRRTRLFGALPSFQENLRTLDALRRQLGCSHSAVDPVYEERYPYLDRDLLEFLYSVPREQLVRPGQRRSLLRRALRQSVPASILDRRRKAFVSRGPLLALASIPFDNGQVGSFGEALGIIDSQELARVARQARSGCEIALVTLIRTLLLEIWLSEMFHHALLSEVPQQPVGTSIQGNENCLLQDLKSILGSAS